MVLTWKGGVRRLILSAGLNNGPNINPSFPHHPISLLAKPLMAKASLFPVYCSYLVPVLAATLPWHVQHLPAVGKRLQRLDPSIVSFAFSLLISQLFPINPAILNILDDVAWRYFLPASVVVGILASSQQAPDSLSRNEITLPTTSAKVNHTTSLVKMLVSFSFGTLGSLLGGLVSMLIFKLINSQTDINSSLIAISDLLKLSAGLTSSYIGGTANLFETVHILGMAQRDWLRVLAVCDIGVMIVYFAILQHRQRQARYPGITSNSRQESTSMDNLPKNESSLAFSVLCMLSVGVSGLFAYIGQVIQQKYLPYPGMSILVVVVLSSLTSGILGQSMRSGRELASVVPRACLRVSSWLLNLFYAVLGLLLQCKDVSRGQLGLLIVLFGSVLATHFAAISLCTSAWNWAVRRLPGQQEDQWTIDTTTMLLASNACVGGSATAVSMASSSSFARADLTLPACVAGIVGYVVGTPLAISLYRWFCAALKSP